MVKIMLDWHAKLLRLTAFPNSHISEETPETWWASVIGETPDNIISQPKLQRYVADATYGLGMVRLNVQPDRIDWLYLASDTNDMDVLPTVGPVASALQLFRNIVSTWFSQNTTPDLNRLAFGAILQAETSNRAEAYSQLNSLLSTVEVDAENSSDFIYQINRPRLITAGDMAIPVNRLSKWTASATVRQDITFTPSRVTQQRAVLQHTATQLELDINTAPDFGEPIEHSLSDSVFSKLVELALEISEAGDIA